MSSEYRFLLVEDTEGVRLVTLNRPEKKNACNIGLARNLTDLLAESADNDDVRVLVLTGAGEGFCSGADMSTFAGKDDGDMSDLPLIGNLHRPLHSFPKPLMAAVNGVAVGMGVTMLPHFDIAYASTEATFATPFVRLGIVVEYASSYTLPRLIGRQRAAEMALRGTPIDAQTAYEWGLVNRLFAPQNLLEETLKVAREIAENGPNALRQTKHLLYHSMDNSLEASIQEEDRVLSTLYGSPEHMAAVQKFFMRKMQKQKT